MKKQRLSLNQKDTLFVLALLETKGITGPIPTTKVKQLIDQARLSPLDPSNYRKGIHTLAKRGLVETVRAHDLSLAISLTRLGRHDAARIYRDRTGNELDAMPADDQQLTIFDTARGNDNDI
ncbi:chromosome segregation protein ParM [Photobacterium leiognathi]|uniref:chromosome segregation protein ParM n=1 Tax=Photobacterium leiognathi TaxID=553611 RepID=UPI000D15C4B1|nr:chromosome segregation protein ParM [Photobacterium leiognathi]PSW53057.1 chromosome segregation protein ParM [Photobacterium leiognathi subsp. mandapamensis]